MENQRAVKYLVTEKDGTTHLPYTGEDGKPNHKLMGDAWAALHGGFRGNKYTGPNKAEAIEKLKAVYKSEGMDTPDEKDSFPDLDHRRAHLAATLAQERGRAAAVTAAGGERQVSEEMESVIEACSIARASCYAAMSYASFLPWNLAEIVSDDCYSALYECYSCAGVFTELVMRESLLARVAATLCSEACRAVIEESTGTEDGILLACSAACERCAAACDGLPDEGRTSGENDEVRACPIEFRSEGEGRKIVGYPILFNSLSQDLGGFVERILPEAIEFADDVRADFNHDPNCILGRTSAGTLKLSVDERGVRMEAEAPDTTWANDLLVSIRRGDINQGSFAFRVLPGGQQIAEEDGQTVRTLSKILVRKVSVVSDPAYTKTAIEVRSTNQVPDSTGDAPGLEAQPASNGGVEILRRRLEEKEREI